MHDVFDLLGSLDSEFRYENAAWARIAAAASSLGCDPGATTVLYDQLLFDAIEIPLRDALEVELGIYLIKIEFASRYPSLTRCQIATKLRKTKRQAQELLRLIKEPEIGLYLLDWASHRGGPRGTILLLEKLLQGLQEREEWLATTRTNLPYPGYTAPKDIEPQTEGFQWQHRGLSDGAEQALIFNVLLIYEKIFRRSVGTQDDGPAAKFLNAAVFPVLGELDESKLRYWLRKFRDHLR